MISNRFSTSSLSEIITISIACIFTIQISYKFGFYSSYNQEWILSLFSPIDILFSNFNLILIYIFSFVYIERIVNAENENKTSLAINGLVMIISSYAYALYKGAISPYFIGIMCAIFICSIGIIKAEKVTTKIFFLLGALIFIPMVYGSLDANKTTIANLPKVNLKDDQNDWRLLDKYSEKIITIKNSSKETKVKEIKIVNIEETQSIQN